MAYHDQSCNTTVEIENLDDSTSTCKSQVVQEIEDCSIDERREEDELKVIKFRLSKEKLAELVQLNDINRIHQYGGLNGIAASLDTCLYSGIRGDIKDLCCRHEAFGSNLNFEDYSSSFDAKKGTLYWIMFNAFKDGTVILLLCCATLSLVIGIKRNGVEEGIIDGAILFLAIAMVVNFSVISNFYKARRNKMIIKQLSRNKLTISISKVIRDGKIQVIAVHEVVVGDIVCLKTGDTVPADGLFIDGDQLFKLDDNSVHERYGYFCNYPSMFTGQKVVGGECRMLVMAVGKNTEKSMLMRLISCDGTDPESRLQISMDKINFRLEKIWLSLSLFVLVVQVLRCFIWNSDQCDENHDPDPKGVKNTVEEIMNEAAKLVKKQQGTRVNGLVAMLCILIFALRDGLPLGFFILLACGKRKMMSSGNVIVRDISAFSTIGSFSTICIGETDDLALQHRKMAELWIGFDNVKDASTGLVANEVIERLREGVYCMIMCCPSEDALLCWAQQFLGNINFEELKQNCTILECEAFGLNRNENLLMFRRKEDSGKFVHVHLEGAPRMVLSKCSHYYNVDGTIQTLDERERALLNTIVERIESNCLQSFAFAHKRSVVQEEEEHLNLENEEEEEEEEEEETLKYMEDGLILLGLLGLKNPYGIEVRQAIEDCRNSGMKIKLVVDRDIKTAAFMGVQSGILEDMEGLIEASEFRNRSEEDQMSMINHISVMAKASPADKLLMVKCLRQKGEVVIFTVTSSRDSLLLKEADLGLLMSNNGSESAQESSDIIVLDGAFATFYDILKAGRYVCNNLKKFIQLQLSLNIVAFMTNFIAVLFKCEVPLKPFQLLWVNLIMDILGALALAALPPSRVPPENPQPVFPPSDPLVTKTMWAHIVFHSLYQVTVLLLLYFKGQIIFHVDERVVKAMVFNCFVFCQVFALINSRELEKMNVFEGILMRKSLGFLVIVVAIVALQVAVINLAAMAIHTAGRLDLKEWGFSIGIAAIVMPIAQKLSDLYIYRQVYMSA